MRSPSSSRRAVFLLFVPLVSVPAVQAAPERTFSGPESIVLRTCDHVLGGRFDEAVALLDAVPPDQLADERVKQLKGWLAYYDRLTKKRETG